MTDVQSNALTAKPAPLTASERVRRTRERRRKGSDRVRLARKRKRDDIVYLGIEISPTERDKLVHFGLLDKADRNDKDAISKAVHTLFDKMRWSNNNGGQNA